MKRIVVTVNDDTAQYLVDMMAEVIVNQLDSYQITAVVVVEEVEDEQA